MLENPAHSAGWNIMQQNLQTVAAYQCCAVDKAAVLFLRAATSLVDCYEDVEPIGSTKE